MKTLSTAITASSLDTSIARRPAKRADPFYLSPKWRTLRDEIVAERGNICEDPQHRGTRLIRGRVFGDHVVELQDGGAPLDKRNILLRCGSCHTRKTAEARRER